MEVPYGKWWDPRYWWWRWNLLQPQQQTEVLVKATLVLVILLASGALLILSQASHQVSQFRHPTMIYDQEGKPWFDLHDPLGTHVKLSDMPPHLAHAVLAVEDRRFYQHGPIDFWGIARAVWENLKFGGVREGASTLSQQLARAVFLTHRRTVTRKLNEALLASQLESEFNKNEILEAYLNRIFMGGSLYGMPSAARYFFGKDVKQIDISEAATLAAIIHSPNFYHPKSNPDKVIGRRNKVLKRMLDEKYISPDQYEYALNERLKFVRMRAVERTETYFKDFVRTELASSFGEAILDEYGYRIHTSFSPQLQALAESSANQEIARLEASRQLYRYPDKPDLQVALVSLEADTGRINAMLGGRNYGGSQYNRATQALRQPGSSFKPILYTAALLQGFTPASTIELAPAEPADIEEIADSSSQQPGTITLREGLRKSVNAAAVALIDRVGKVKTIELAHQLGIQTELPEVQSLALGAGEVRVLELAGAYMAFPSAGNIATPHCIVRVEDAQGRSIYQEKQRPVPVLPREIAYQITSMLRDVVTRGTAATAASAGIPFSIAGKTGTTNEYKDAWFLGFSPRIVCGVWVGYDNPRPIMPGGYGVRLALPIWARYMRSTAKLIRHGNFAIPNTLRPYSLCRISGGLATEGCNYALRPDGTTYSTVYTEYLIPGTEPQFPCPIHIAAAPQPEGGFFENLKKWLPKIIPPLKR
ncbi:MAG TPA: PBP1A family penicillin-binding protein [Acidobacteriota bacterium]|jgi:1A family penicillin-binding protein|nr:PBP1A family penicillin-binding protein [Acidobacteriota bacterium]